MTDDETQISHPQRCLDDLYAELERRYGPGFAQAIMDGLRRAESQGQPDCLLVTALAEIHQDLTGRAGSQGNVIDIAAWRLAPRIAHLHDRLYRQAMAAYDAQPWTRRRRPRPDPEKAAA